MINKDVLDGFTSLDGCYKLSDSDSTIDCYVIPRSILERKKEIDDWELKTNSVYLLVGEQDDKIMAYAGKGELGKDKESAMRRLQQHLTRNAELTEKYFPFWTQALVFVCKNTDPSLQWDTSITGDLEAILIGDIKYEYNWKGKSESIRNPLSPDRIRGHAIKLASIKGYVKELGFTFLDEDNTAVSSENLSKNSSGSTIVTEEEIAKQEKQIIDKTVALETKNLEINARIPEYTTPEKVVNQMLDLLPWDTFNHETRFLDLACKGGEFLALIHDRLSVVLQKDEYFSKYTGKEKDVRIHDYIVNNQLYGVAIGDNSYAITMDRVYDCPHIVKAKTGAQGYINYIKCLSGTDIKKQYEKQQILKAKQSYINEILGVQNMKFDVVIGNPPYQESTGSGLNESGGTALFDSFIINGVLTTNRLLCMITPTKWLAGNMKTFVKVRHTLLDEGHLRKMVDYMNAKDIFNGRSIAGGVSYFLYDKQYKGDTDFTTINNQAYNETRKLSANDIVPRHYIGDTVIDKVRQKSTDYISDYIYKNLWGLGTDYDGNPIRTNDNEVEVITPRGYSYAEFDYRPKYCDTYKVAFTRVVPDHAVEPDKTFKYRILSSLQVLKPGQICNASYMAVCNINKEEYANNIKGYLETKFVRFLVLQTLFGIGLTPDRFQFVPMQNFKEAWTDEKLYSKYNLSADEIVFIEKIMAPLNNNGSAKATVPAIIKNNVAPSAPKLTAQDAMANYINKRVQSEQE